VVTLLERGVLQLVSYSSRWQRELVKISLRSWLQYWYLRNTWYVAAKDLEASLRFQGKECCQVLTLRCWERVQYPSTRSRRGSETGCVVKVLWLLRYWPFSVTVICLKLHLWLPKTLCIWSSYGDCPRYSEQSLRLYIKTAPSGIALDISEAPFGIARDSLYLKLLRGLPETTEKQLSLSLRGGQYHVDRAQWPVKCLGWYDVGPLRLLTDRAILCHLTTYLVEPINVLYSCSTCWATHLYTSVPWAVSWLCPGG